MNNKEQKGHYAYEALVILGLLAALTWICHLWPVLLLLLLGILIAAIRLLFLSVRRVEVIEPLPVSSEPIREPTEKDVRALAYSVILRRITEFVAEEYPEARWVWETPNAKQEIEKNGAVYILLNRAGGYRRARVILQNLQVVRVDYHMSEPEEKPDSEKDEEQNEAPEGKKAPEKEKSPKGEEAEKENYGLIAFEWVETHILELNARCNEAVGQGFAELVLMAEELPIMESWSEVCQELERAGLADVQCVPDGIKINLSSETAERE